MRCTYIKSNGEQCKNSTIEGQVLCWIHSVEEKPRNTTFPVAAASSSAAPVSQHDYSHPYLEVLLTEYRSTRESLDVRNSILVSIMNFLFVVVSASIVLLGVVLEAQSGEPLLLVVSVILSLIGLVYLSNSYVMEDLSAYENEELRPKIENYLKSTTLEFDSELETVLTYQSWARQRTASRSLMTKAVMASTLYVPGVFSLGAIVLFLFFKNLHGGNVLGPSPSEFYLLAIAVLCFIFYTIGVVSRVSKFEWFNTSGNK